MSRQQARTFYNIEGNTVRKANVMPERVPGEERGREREQRVRREIRANRRRAMQMNPGYLLFLTAAVVLTLGICARFIQLQTEINTRMRNVATMESQVLDMKTDNDATLSRIETSINMDEMRAAAINELGMVYPGQDQIVYFQVESNDYMNQYQDIPEK